MSELNGWPSEAREAVARAIWDRSELYGGTVWEAYLPEADAVLAALSAHAVPRAAYEGKLDLIRKLSDEFVDNKTVPRAAVLDLAHRCDDASQRRGDDLDIVAAELRALLQSGEPPAGDSTSAPADPMGST